MDNRRLPAIIAVIGIVVAVGLFFVLRDDTADEDTEIDQTASTAQESTPQGEGGEKDQKPKPEPEPEVPSIDIQGGEVVGGTQEFEFTEGDEIRIEITTDAADELHFHGYDVYLDIEPGKTNELVVDQADIGGVFELESHSTGALFANVSVVPG